MYMGHQPEMSGGEQRCTKENRCDGRMTDSMFHTFKAKEPVPQFSASCELEMLLCQGVRLRLCLRRIVHSRVRIFFRFTRCDAWSLHAACTGCKHFAVFLAWISPGNTLCPQGVLCAWRRWAKFGQAQRTAKQLKT